MVFVGPNPEVEVDFVSSNPLKSYTSTYLLIRFERKDQGNEPFNLSTTETTKNNHPNSEGSFGDLRKKPINNIPKKSFHKAKQKQIS